MSFPSNTPLPRRGINGWQIAGIGCLGLFLLAAVGGIFLVRTVQEKISHPSKNDVMGVAILAGQASIDGAHLRQGIVSYHQQHGHYPKTLEDMVQDGTVDGKLLHNGLDDNPSPGHVSWRYLRPAENALGSTPILSEPYQITVGSNTQPGKIVITLDGRSQANSQINSQTPTP